MSNKRGDTHMAIGFGETADLSGAWSPAVRVIGFLAGDEVARSEWFTDVDDSMSFFAMNLSGVDRVVIESRVATQGAGFYALDDLTFTGADGVERILDFEDLSFRTVVTGSPYEGLIWEEGTGTFDRPAHDSGSAVRQPAAPDADAQGQGGSSIALGRGGTTPNLIQDFNGPRQGDPGAGFIPPVTCGAVGTDHFVAVVNEHISVYDKVTGNRLVNSPLDSFMNANAALDPRVVFDPDSQRWIIIGTNFTSGEQIFVAVSTSDDATGSFFKFNFITDGGSDAGRWPDYPTLGVDQRGIYSSAYMVGGQARMTLFALDKAPLVAASPSVGTVSAFRNLAWEGAIQPAVHWEDDGGAYCVSVNSTNRIRVRKVLPPMTNPTLQLTGFTTVSTHSSPPDAPAMGSNTPLDTVGDRLMNAVYRKGSIWTAHCVGVSGRSVARWYEIDPGSVGSAVQQGTINEPGMYFLFPTIGVNSKGDAAVGMSASNSSMFAGAWVTGRKATDPAGEMGTPFEYRSGAGPYNNLDGSGSNPWGDYSLTSADPVDDSFWTLQERARNNNSWATTVANVAFEPDAIERYCVTSPNSFDLQGSVIDNTGSASIGANDLALFATGNPPNPFGLFFFGDAQVQVTGGNGILCVGGGIFRFPPVQIDGLGFASYTVDNGNPPAGLPSFVSGETWNFQFWLRDPFAGGAGYNFSDALEITFQP